MITIATQKISGCHTGAVLFADLCDSTELYEILGDGAALGLVKSIFHKSEEVARKYGGCLVKTIGDEVMLSFPNSYGALSTAVEMQRLMEACSADTGKELFLRIGVNAGELRHENGDVFGDAVNVAARFVDFAAPGKIVTSMTIFSDEECRRNFDFRNLGTYRFKGKSEPIECCEVIWKFDSTLTIMGRSDLDNLPCRLYLEYCGVSMEMDVSGKVSIGRGRENTIQVDQPSVSRHHAVIEGRSNAFSVVDHSTNGTTIIKIDRPPVLINHQTYSLSGEGVLVLGQADDSDNRTTIVFRVLS
jgi:hypothetical protein